MAKVSGIWKNQSEAVNEFTDREDPQEAFERKVRVLSETWKDDYYVLCYYGIGGIGKTRFVNEMCRMIRGVSRRKTRLLDKIDCNYIKYDFGAETSSMDKLSILLSLRKQLAGVDKSFRFYRFDSAVCFYAKKIGANIEENPTVKSFLEDSPWLESLISTVGLLPGISGVTGVIQTMDKAVKTVRTIVENYIDRNRYKEHLEEIDGLEASDILDKRLHEYFILDMQYNMQQIATKPLIVFLDTYEKYVDTLKHEKTRITEDHWLRKGDRSVIRSIPGVLWVITGREKLYWSDDDAWEEAKPIHPLAQMNEEEKENMAKTDLEQHLLGDLSENDAKSFLQKAGINNTEIAEELYRLTNGTPLFLDICVKTYRSLLAQGKQPEINAFGADLTELISRYLSNMDRANCQMAYFLACLGTWNNQWVRSIAEKATVLNWYTYLDYERFSEHSFIIKNPDGTYYMHETVKNAILKNADKEIIEEISKIKLSLLRKELTRRKTIDDIGIFEQYVGTITAGKHSYEEICYHIETVKNRFCELSNEGRYSILCSLAKDVFEYITKFYCDTGMEYIARSLYGNALRLIGDKEKALEMITLIPFEDENNKLDELEWCFVKLQAAKIYRDNRDYKKALSIFKQVYEMKEKLLGRNNRETLQVMRDIANVYSDLGFKSDVLELRKQVFEICESELGINDPDTLAAMNDLIISINFEDEKPLLELRNQLYGKCKEVFGAEHPNTLIAMLNLANAYSVTGEENDARILRQDAMIISQEAFGEEHPKALGAMIALSNSYANCGNGQLALELRKKVYDIKKRTIGVNNFEMIKVRRKIADSYQQLGEVRLEIEEREKQLESCREVVGNEHPYTLELMIYLSERYFSEGYYGNAHKLIEEAWEISQKTIEFMKTDARLLDLIIAIRTKRLGEENSDTLQMIERGVSYYWEKDIGKAIALQKDVLRIRKKAFSDDCLAIAREIDMLKTMYELESECNEIFEIVRLQEESLEIKKNALGIEHNEVQSNMERLANRYYRFGDYEKAIDMYRQVVDIIEKTKGEDSVLINSMRMLAESYFAIGDFHSAIELYCRVVDLEKRIRGTDDYNVFRDMKSLANIYSKAEAYCSAVGLRKQIFEHYACKYGISATVTLQSMVELAKAYESIGDREKMIKICEEVIAIAEKTYGDDVYETLLSKVALAETYEAVGEKQKAIEVLETVWIGYEKLLNSSDDDPADDIEFVERVLKLKKKLCGVENVDTLCVMEQLAICYLFSGQKEKALELFYVVLENRKEILGNVHPDSLQTRANIAKCIDDQGEKIEQYEQVLRDRIMVLGYEHLDTIETMKNLADIYRWNGEVEKSINMYEKVIKTSIKRCESEDVTVLSYINNIANYCYSVGRFQKAVEYRKLIPDNIKKKIDNPWISANVECE